MRDGILKPVVTNFVDFTPETTSPQFRDDDESLFSFCILMINILHYWTIISLSRVINVPVRSCQLKAGCDVTMSTPLLAHAQD